MHARFIAVAHATIGAVVFVACVGDDPGSGEGGNDSGITPGDRGGPCKSGVCLAGLTCVDNICVLVDGAAANDGAPTADGAGDSDAFTPADTGSDAQVTCNSGNGDTTTVVCGGSVCTRGTQDCCLTNGTLSCAAPNACPNTKIECDSAGECPSGPCCVEAVLGNTANSCPTLSLLKPTVCVPATGCGVSRTQVCSTNADCTVQGESCKELVMDQNGVFLKLGVCVK